MKIGNVEQGKGIDRAKRKKDVSGSGSSAFADRLRDASGGGDTAAAETGMIDHAALDGVDALLAMQEVGDATDERTRRQANAYAEDLLDRLTGLQDALLRGAIPKESLMDLAKKIRAGRINVQDKRLKDILDEIELRAEVEIAKFTRGG
jgi:hypothetical protein